jgi:hypothetical protein
LWRQRAIFVEIWVIIVIPILLAAVVAVLVAKYLRDRKAKGGKLYIFTILTATRHSRKNNEAVRALKMIDVAFYKEKTVRRLGHEYFEMLNHEGLNNPTGYKARQQKNLELITEMAKVLGYVRK